MANKRNSVAAFGESMTLEVGDATVIKLDGFTFEFPADEALGVDASDVTLVTKESLDVHKDGDRVKMQVGLTALDMPAKGSLKVTRPKKVSKVGEPQ